MNAEKCFNAMRWISRRSPQTRAVDRDIAAKIVGRIRRACASEALRSEMHRGRLSEDRWTECRDFCRNTAAQGFLPSASGRRATRCSRLAGRRGWPPRAPRRRVESNARYCRTRKIKRRNSPGRDAVFPLRIAGGLLERRYKEPGNPLRRYARHYSCSLHNLDWPGLVCNIGFTCSEACTARASRNHSCLVTPFTLSFYSPSACEL